MVIRAQAVACKAGESPDESVLIIIMQVVVAIIYFQSACFVQSVWSLCCNMWKPSRIAMCFNNSITVAVNTTENINSNK